MGKLTKTVFNESCCDGGICNINKNSMQPCGCDPGANHECSYHTAYKEGYVDGYQQALNDATVSEDGR